MPEITRPLPTIPSHISPEEVLHLLPDFTRELGQWVAQQVQYLKGVIEADPRLVNDRIASGLRTRQLIYSLEKANRGNPGDVLFILPSGTDVDWGTFGSTSPSGGTPSIAGQALTRVNDTNVTLTLGGTPATALLQAVSLTLGWSGTLAISRGGTGQSTAAAAFDALSPLTTKGDLLGHTGAANTRIPVGTDGYVLTADSGDAEGVSWQPASGSGPHDLLDGDQNQDTDAYTVARGSLIVGTAAPLWDGLPIGAAGKVLCSDGTDALWEDTLAEELTFDKSLILKGIAFEQDTPLPARPSSGYGKLFADLLNRTHPAMYNEFGMMQHIQGLVGHSGACAILPGTGTAPNVWGTAVGTASGTVSHPALATTNYSTSIRRIRVTSAASTNASSSLFENQAHWWLGNAANRGGFKIVMRFFTSADPSLAAFWFMGLHGSVASIGNTAPSNLGNCIGVGMEDVAGTPDTELNIFHNDAAGGATKVPTGLAWTSTSVFQLEMVAAPNASDVDVRVTRIDDPSVAPFEANLSSNLPASTTFLAMHFHSNTGATDTGPVIMHPIRGYGETDI